MGVDATHYVVIGVRFEYDRFDEDFRENVLSAIHDNGYQDEITANSDGVTCISDGMSGKYTVLGRVISKGVAEHGEGLPFTKVTIGSLHDGPLLCAIRAVVGELTDTETLNCYAFTHYH